MLGDEPCGVTLADRLVSYLSLPLSLSFHLSLALSPSAIRTVPAHMRARGPRHYLQRHTLSSRLFNTLR